LGRWKRLFQVEEEPDIPNENVWELAGSALFLGVVASIPVVGALVAGIGAAAYVLAQQETAPAPSDFKGALADVSDWLDASFEGAITTVDNYAADVAGNWDTEIEAPGYVPVTLADLADAPAPAKGTQDYDTIWQAAMTSVKRAMWQSTLNELFEIVEWGSSFDTPTVGSSPEDVFSKLADKAGNLACYYPVFGQGIRYFAKQKEIAYKGNIGKAMPSGAASWIFSDDALGNPRPANETDTAFCTHADVFGTYDPVAGTWASGSGWITLHVPMGK
jgi:hypothetical protein